MDKRIQIWNILHDGELTAFSEDNNKILTLFVSIPYLRRRLKPLGDSFVLKMYGLKLIEFRDLDGFKTKLEDELDSGSPAILSTQSETMPVTIETTLGQLILNFETIEFTLDTGEGIEFEAIEKVCDSYWTEWKEKTSK